MWRHTGRLPHVLPPAAYHDAAIHTREVERLFASRWHFVATQADLAKHGAFVTLDLFGSPVLVRNDSGTVRAYLNVCAHRHALLSSEPHGQSPHLECQYHGWRYAPDGHPCHVPQAASFAPVEKGRERLRTLPVARRGALWFVSLVSDPSPIDDALGPVTAAFCDFGEEMVQHERYRVEHAANWKIVVENAVESYHLPRVHPLTLALSPCVEADITHDLGERHTTLVQVEQGLPLAYRVLLQTMRRRSERRFVHHHAFPSLIFVRTDLVSVLQLVVPTSPMTSVSHVRSWVHRGERVAARVISRAMRPLVSAFSRRVFEEDNRILANVQKGLRASVHAGVLGACEERVYAFQRWVELTTSDQPEVVSAAGVRASAIAPSSM